MYTLLLFLFGTCWCAGALAEVDEYLNLEKAEIYFKDFITKFNKQYKDESEKEHRFQIFKSNLERINHLNKQSKDTTKVFGITKFIDLSPEEFQTKYTCLKINKNSANDYDLCDTVKTDEDIIDTDAPESFDWRQENAVTHVKDQGPCGSCWAFATIGHIEALYAIKYGNLTEFSEQQLVDCAKGCMGCFGGLLSSAYKALIELEGPMKEEDYKYEATQRKCRSQKEKVIPKVVDCISYNLTSQEKVKQLLHKIGPISIGIRSDALQMYTTGIIKDQECPGRVNHAVLLVGYGTENGVPYWIVKNSWGEEEFGEGGYFRMQRSEDPNEACGMMNVYMATAVVE